MRLEPALTDEDYPLVAEDPGGSTNRVSSSSSSTSSIRAFSPSRRQEDRAYEQSSEYEALTDWYTAILFEAGERLRLPMVSTAVWLDDDDDDDEWWCIMMMDDDDG